MSKFLEVANEPISFGNSISSYVSPQGELYFTPPVSFFGRVYLISAGDIVIH